MKLEITHDLNLSAQEKNLLDMHSFLNIMNILNAWIALLNHEAKNPKILRPCIDHILNITDNLGDRNQALESAKSLDSTQELINVSLKKLKNAQPDIIESEIYKDLIKNFETLFSILKVRAREILARNNEAEMWVGFELDQLETNFINVFTAVEMNSNGQYRIVYNIANKNENDYLVNMQIDSIDGDSIKIPATFQDIMRDLILNARKYSPHGSTITFGLLDNGENIRFTVTDNGIGIPEDQIKLVVNYGVRARNAMNKRTMGGGFGLTKAYYFTRQLNGRFWIDSELGVGTSIEIEFPNFTHYSSKALN